MREYLSTNRQQKRKDQRQADVNQLLALGWKETVQGIWRDPKGKYAYPTRGAIELEQLRGNILRGGNRRKALVRKKTEKNN